MTRAAITQGKLRDLLHYEPDTGVFTWIRPTNGNIRVGDEAGHVQPNGYRLIRVLGRTYGAHRLAWLYVHGCFPPEVIDHANRVPDDNRISNLRAATRAENRRNSKLSRNNKSGANGVCFDKYTKRWRVTIMMGGKNIHLGYFSDVNDAVRARHQAEPHYFGEFSPLYSARGGQ